MNLKKILTVLLLIGTIVSTGLAQNSKDEKGRKQGFWRKADSAGKVIYEGNFKDDKPFGEFRYFYEDGKVRNKLMYSNDGKTAVSISYHPNGVKMAEGIYVSTKKDSLWKYFDEKGNLVSEEHYIKNIPCGTWKNYFPDGKLLEQYSFNKTGLKEGAWKQYYNSGTIKLSSVYQSGKLQGKAFYYYPDGSLLMQGSFKNDLKVGEWLSFNETGKKAISNLYNENGRLINTVYFDKQKEQDLTAPEKEIRESK
jgi:antitoxin component YwqK of YwqJK toxin-antitoxin module